MSSHSVDKLFKKKLGNYRSPVREGIWPSIETRLDDHSPVKKSYRSWGLVVLAFLTSVVLLSIYLDYQPPSIYSWLNNQKETSSMKKYTPAASASSSPDKSEVESSVSDVPIPGNDAEINIDPFRQHALPIQPGIPKASSGLKIVPPLSTGNTDDRQNPESGPSQGVTAATDILETNAQREARFNAGDRGSIWTSPILENSGSYLLDGPDLEGSLTGKVPTDCYKFGKGVRGSFFTDLYVGPVYAFQGLSSRDIEVEEYIDRRQQTEMNRLSLDVGLRVGYMTPRGYSVMTGLHFTKANRLFDFFNPDEQRIETIITIDTVITPDTIIVTMDTSQVVITGKRIKKTYNRYYTLDIPLLFGYEFMHGSWSLGIQAGPVFNLLFEQRGDILSTSGDPVNIDSNNPQAYPAYKSSLGLSVYASLQANKRIGNTLYFFLEPHLLYRFNSLTRDNYPIDERQQNVGLSVGLRMKI